MELKLDIKTLVVGIALGAILTLAIGAGRYADYTPFAVPIEPDGTALVKMDNGGFYVVSGLRAMASRVLEADIKSNSDDVRRPANPPFTVNSPSRSQ